MNLTAQPANLAIGINPARMLDWAIIQTLAYADVFDFPLRIEEIHRYLIGMETSRVMLSSALFDQRLSPGYIEQHGELFTLPGRGELISVRERRRLKAQQMWPEAIRFGDSIARIPFVRMVAVTGSLALDNVNPGADYDYLIVTHHGRLWLCRALVTLLVRKVSLGKKIICPNYFISERALIFPVKNLYSAHEVVQMVPISGFHTYQRLRAGNAWTDHYLPNAKSAPRVAFIKTGPIGSLRSRGLQNGVESLLSTPIGSWMESWEMERKVRKFNSRNGHESEADFGPDWCKGHFNQHGQWAMKAFNQRLEQYENFRT